MRIFVELEKSRTKQALKGLRVIGFKPATSGRRFTPVEGKPNRVMTVGDVPETSLNSIVPIDGVITWQLAEEGA